MIFPPGLSRRPYVQPDVLPDLGAPGRPAAGQRARPHPAAQLAGARVQTLPAAGSQTHLPAGQEVSTPPGAQTTTRQQQDGRLQLFLVFYSLREPEITFFDQMNQAVVMYR